MPTPTFVAYTNTVGGTQVEPTGTQQGDIVLAVMNGVSAAVGPAGWTKILSDRTAAGETANAWWIVRGSSAPSYTWTNSPDGGAVASFRGALPSLHTSAQSAAASNVSPAITTLVNDALCVSIYADNASSTITAPAGTTFVTNGVFDAMATFVQATPGTTATKTWQNTSSPIGTWTVALVPPVAIPPFNTILRPNIQWRI
jgi:hypothetical protein